MSQISRRRRGPDQGNRDAASEPTNASTSPTDVEALAALRTLRAWLGSSTPAIFTQHDLPPDVTSADAYARRHRALRKAKVDGVWARGKTLACTPCAWAHELPRTKAKLTIVEPAQDDAVAEVAAALGIRVRAK